MNFMEFKEKLIAGLNDLYGKDAQVKEVKVPKCNGQSYEGVQVSFDKPPCTGYKVVPVVSLSELYSAYNKGELVDMNDCIEAVCRINERNGRCEDVTDFAVRIQEWEYVKERVYPILLPTKGIQEFLENLVSLPVLDLSIVYIIRGEFQDGEMGTVKVSRSLLRCYGITEKELHEQALRNLEQDGYAFRDMGCS